MGLYNRVDLATCNPGMVSSTSSISLAPNFFISASVITEATAGAFAIGCWAPVAIVRRSSSPYVSANSSSCEACKEPAEHTNKQKTLINAFRRPGILWYLLGRLKNDDLISPDAPTLAPVVNAATTNWQEGFLIFLRAF